MKNAINAAKAAATAQANLNAWGAVVALLEGGTLSGENTHSAQQRVIKIAQAEMQKHLREYDTSIAAVTAMCKTPNDKAQGAGGSFIAGGSPGAAGSAAGNSEKGKP
jgi:hypothetical protein